MSFSAFHSLVSGKRPVWLYQITLDGSTTYYTNKAGGYTYSAQAYTQANVAHSSIKQTPQISRAQVTLTFPRSNTVAQTARDTLDLASTSVKILYGDENDPDQEFVTWFSGRVISTKPLWPTISLICENNFTAFRRKAIGAIMQRPCRHALYYGRCPAVLADNQTSATATDWTDPVLTVTEAASQADGFYTGGLVEYGGKFQMITKHEGTSLTLLHRMESLNDEITASGSATVDIARGCNRTMAHCIAITGSAAPHGGFPWMSESPFDGRLIY